MSSSLIIYYDKECFFCRNYAKYISLGKKHLLELRNAREYKKEMKQYYDQGVDINLGMIIEHHNTIYHGADAILYIQYLLTYNKFLTRKVTKILRSPCYRCINNIRRGLLGIQGTNNIR